MLTRWYTINEAMPDYGERVLMSTDTMVCEGFLGRTKWRRFDDLDHELFFGKVIAWMPLPRPYGTNENEHIKGGIV